MTTPSPAPDRRVAAARHVCQEARLVLTSLRGGPPPVARGELAQDLMELRDRLQTSSAVLLPVEETTEAVPTTTTPAPPSTPPPLETPSTTPTSTEDSIVMDEYSQPFLQVVMDHEQRDLKLWLRYKR